MYPTFSRALSHQLLTTDTMGSDSITPTSQMKVQKTQGYSTPTLQQLKITQGAKMELAQHCVASVPQSHGLSERLSVSHCLPVQVSTCHLSIYIYLSIYLSIHTQPT